VYDFPKLAQHGIDTIAQSGDLKQRPDNIVILGYFFAAVGGFY
jgi:hypothetical protein